MKLIALSLISGLSMWAGSGGEAFPGDGSKTSLPLLFMENRGQAPGEVRYMMKRPDYSAYFLEKEIVLRMQGKQLSIRLVNAQKPLSITGEANTGGVANFLIGTEAADWVTGVPLEGAVRYREVWPGIDMVYGSNERKLKSEFQMMPGADFRRIRWSYGAGMRTRKESDGSLRVTGSGMDFREDAPVIYQERLGRRVGIAGSFLVEDDGSVGFDVGKFDSELPLILDPVISFSTFLGGSSQDQATAVALDGYGNSYIAGWTTSANLAQSGPVKLRGFSGSVDAFIARFHDLGDRVVYCTYLGGSGDDRALGLAVDGGGNAYVTGYTTSTNFPVSVAAIQKRNAGGRDAFLTKLNATGTAILYSSYFGGSGNDTAYGVAIDPAGNAYFTGDTSSTNLPLAGAIQTANHGGQDAFIAAYNPSGTALLYSTYFGGSGDDHVAAIAVNNIGSAFITGSTYSPDFPVKSALQAVTGGNQDAFVAGLAPQGNGLVFSTYLGGLGGTPGLLEEGAAIVVDPGQNLYVAGTTSSLNFPVSTNALQKVIGGGNTDGFVVEYGPNAQSVKSSSYLGGSGVDRVTGLAVDRLGYIHVVGYTSSQDFPTIRAVQRGNNGQYNGFFTKYHPGLTSVTYSTYLGGSGSDAITGVAADFLGNAVVTGYTSSSDFPMRGPLGSAQGLKYGYTSAFVTKVASSWTAIAATPYAGMMIFVYDWAHNSGWDGTPAWREANFGLASDIPITGDWNNSGTMKVGVVRNGVWMLDWNGNGVWDGPGGGDRQFTLGQAGDIPIVGDWDGSGTLKAGFVRGTVWNLDMSGLLQGIATGQAARVYTFGVAGDVPVVGDWTGSGVSRAGVYRGGQWLLDTNGNFRLDAGEPVIAFGISTDLPVVGDWDGSGISRPAVFRNGTWFFSYDQTTGQTPAYSSIDLSFGFGVGFAIPLVGK